MLKEENLARKKEKNNSVPDDYLLELFGKSGTFFDSYSNMRRLLFLLFLLLSGPSAYAAPTDDGPN